VRVQASPKCVRRREEGAVLIKRDFKSKYLVIMSYTFVITVSVTCECICLNWAKFLNPQQKLNPRYNLI
jgi:hypothetical protein